MPIANERNKNETIPARLPLHTAYSRNTLLGIHSPMTDYQLLFTHLFDSCWLIICFFKQSPNLRPVFKIARERYEATAVSCHVPTFRSTKFHPLPLKKGGNRTENEINLVKGVSINRC